jgi:hypothetical protein
MNIVVVSSVSFTEKKESKKVKDNNYIPQIRQIFGKNLTQNRGVGRFLGVRRSRCHKPALLRCMHGIFRVL